MPVTIVVGGQAGSEGKGAVTARLAEQGGHEYVVRVGGPNAGHSVVDSGGTKFALRQLPVAAVVDEGANLVIAAGSEIDLEVLDGEIEELEGRGYNPRRRLLIDREATILDSAHREAERAILTGTTGKGIGAARAERALRRGVMRAADIPRLQAVDTQSLLQRAMQRQRRILIEGTQGFVLGSHAGYYPHCTSGDCRASDFLAAAGLPPTRAEVWIVLRSYPIRIAGNSGPLPNELTWEEVGVEPEITTVTKKVRRVAGWNWEWAERAVRANLVPESTYVALTFADYWWPDIALLDGWLPRIKLADPVRDRVREIEERLHVQVAMLGTGPASQLLLEGEWV